MEAQMDAGPDRTDVDAVWARVQTSNGVLLKITTFGSDDRMSEAKPSQVIFSRSGDGTSTRYDF